MIQCIPYAAQAAGVVQEVVKVGNKEVNVALSSLSGVGPVRSGKLAKLGLERLGDVLWHFPLRYEDRRKLKDRRLPNSEWISSALIS